MAAAIDLQLVVRRQMLHLEDLLLQLRREDVDAANDQHVVAASADAIHPPHAARGARQQAGQIAGTVADHRQGLFGQGGEQQLAVFAIRQRRAVVRVDYFRIEMVLPDGRAVGGFQTLHRHPRPHHFRKAVDIQGCDPETTLDFRPHRQRPRLGAEYANPQRAAAGIAAHLPLQFFNQVQAVGGRDHNHIRLKIADQLRLFFRLAAGHRDHRGPQTLRAVVRAKAAGKQAVAVGDVDFIFCRAAGGAQGAGDDIGPGIDIILRVAHHRRFAGGPGRGVDAHNLLHRHRKGIERVVIAQILFGGARELAQVAQFVEIVRMHPRRVKLAAVHRNVVVSMFQRPFQTLGLQSL